jgi:hypothetical protein
VAEDGQRAAVLGDVERMIELLAEPLPPPTTLSARIAEWWTGKLNSRRGWRQIGIGILEEIRKRLLRGEAAVDEGAMEVLVWWVRMGKAETNEIWSMGGGAYLEAETDEIRSLALSIRRGVVELSEEVTTEPVARASMVKEVFVDDEATPEETVAVEEAFARAGFPVTVARGLLPPPDVEHWAVVGTIGVPIPAFFAAFTDEGAKDTSGAVKRWAHEIFEARRGSGGWRRGEIMLHGRLDTVITLSSDMPKTAFESLPELDWGPLAQGATVASDILAADFRWHLHTRDPARYFKWDAAQNEWIDQYQRHRSRSRRAWLNRFLLPLIRVVVAGLAGLRRRRRAD